MKQFRLSIIVDLPDDLFASASIIAGIQPQWSILTDQLTETGVTYETVTEVTTDEALAAAAHRRENGPARKRKPGRPAGSKNNRASAPMAAPIIGDLADGAA